MSKSAGLLCLFGLCVILADVGLGTAAEPDRKGIEFFEKRIRPMLVQHCYECHSGRSKDLQGGLLLDTREGIRRGGESGHAVVPENLADSLLLSAIRFEDFEMPPEKQLPENVIADFEKWIKMGAPDPRDGSPSSLRPEIDFDAAREFWSFQPLQQTPPPSVVDTTWPHSDIDRFILARLELNGLRPVVDADPVVLVRRVYFDLIGLPPTPAQVDEFVADPSPAALRELIDRLLDSPQYGERWGRHWLDVVRYGESTGMERNFTYPYAWRYRDYVIKSFYEDKPFDQFITEQVAGDLLPYETIQERNEHLIATGMLAMGTKSLNEPNKEKFTMDVVDEQIDVTTQAILGLTASCARCHDHKFDPIPQKEYYALAGIFCSTETFYGTGGIRGNRRAGRLLALEPDRVRPVAASGASRKEQTKLTKQLKSARKKLQQFRKQATKEPAAKSNVAKTQAQVKKLQRQLAVLKRNASSAPQANESANAILAMAVGDAAQPADTQIRIRGNANERGDTTPRGFLTILSRGQAPQIDSSGSGRLQYAQWLVRRDNPLTARVAVNRVWQHLFGRGIVSTVNNFGANGDRPTHPRVLDYLATQFIQNGWSTKHVIRTVMNSRVYQLSSSSSARAESIDPNNHLLWKMNQRRLEVEALRDAMLAASGQLDSTPGKGSIVQSVGDGDIGRTLRTDRFAVSSVKRSVYLPIVRGVVPEMFHVFDFPHPSIIFGQRDVTTVPTQALYMMNSPFVIEHAHHFARRVRDEEPLDEAQRVALAYRIALTRSPMSSELDQALQFIGTASASLQGEKLTSDEANVEAWAGFCQALFACAEFRYVD